MFDTFRRLGPAVRYRRRMKRLVAAVEHLPIADAGTDASGMRYASLEDGMRFYGHADARRYPRLYRRLSAAVRSKLPPECLRLAFDVAIRFVEGGLQHEGPRKERHYRVQPGDTVAEMGAYMGHFSMYLAKRVGPRGRVIAIEPNPANVAVLRRNVAENGLENVTVVPKGVWHDTDHLTFFVKPGDMQSSSVVLEDEGKERLEVPVDTLDNILSQADVRDVALMIIQLNGAEPNALQGLNNIRPRHLAIASRYTQNGRSTTPDIVSTLTDRGYSTEVVDDAFVFAWLGND